MEEAALSIQKLVLQSSTEWDHNFLLRQQGWMGTLFKDTLWILTQARFVAPCIKLPAFVILENAVSKEK